MSTGPWGESLLLKGTGMYKSRRGRDSTRFAGNRKWMGLARTQGRSEEEVGGEVEERGRDQRLGGLRYHAEGLDLRKNVSLSDG